MKPGIPIGTCRFQLRLLSWGNHYYIERIEKLEALLRKAPACIQLDLIGEGEIPADFALLIRHVLMQRFGATRLITNARSSLVDSAVMVWLLGDKRVLREDARLFFRSVDASETDDSEEEEERYKDSCSTGTDPEESDYATVLEVINQYLPVEELAGKVLRLPLLREYGLIHNESVDQFLAQAFGRAQNTNHYEI